MSQKSGKVTDNKFLQYFYNLLAVWDESWNVILGGSRNETISGRLGRAFQSGEAKWFAIFGYYSVNLMFFWQEDHCTNAYDPSDNIEDEVWSWIKKRKPYGYQ